MNIRTLWGQLAQDLRYASRTLAANPLFASMAVLSLALGIGANTAIYSFMEAILMRSLPVQNPESLVVFKWHSKGFPKVAHGFNGNNYTDPKTGMTSGNFPYPAFELMRADESLCSSVFGFSRAGGLNLLIQGQADRVQGEFVTGAFFSGLGLPPAAGRLLDENDDRTVAAVVALSYAYAQKRFAEPAQAVGKQVTINSQPFTIVGVTPQGFYGVDPASRQDLYLPMHSNALLATDPKAKPNAKYTDGNSYWIEIMGRLRPGVSSAQLQARMAGVFQPFIESTAHTDKERADLPAFLAMPGAAGLERLRRRYSEPLYVLMTLVGLILAIACANIANLLLARATSRRREMAVRLSLGAGRARVIRQLLTESLLMATLGGVLGVFFAHWGIGLLTFLIAGDNPDMSVQASLNWNVLAVTLALSLLTGILFGLVPALQATRVDLVSALKQTRAGDPGLRLRRSWLRVNASQALVTGQIAVSLLLLVAAGLFLRTLSNLDAVQLGFNREHLLLFSVNAKQAGYRDAELVRFYENLRAQFQAIPGIRGVSLSNYALASGSLWKTDVTVPGAADAAPTGTAIMWVGPSFLATMQIPILLGRDLTDRDQSGAAKVAVVNDLFAKKYFGGGNPLGRHIAVGSKSAPDVEIVGVAKATRHQSLKNDIEPVVYLAYGADPADLGGMNYEVRAAGDPLALVATVRRLAQAADSRIPLSDVHTQAELIDQTIGQERTFATLCTWFALLAVSIACVGLYGTMAYAVARRTNEIGVRMALGARRGRLVWMVLREVLALSAAGLAIGLPVAYALAHVVESYLFGMKARDPLVLVAAPLVLIVAAVAAGYGPALRASRIDPWTALRNE
jgi:predicted permease